MPGEELGDEGTGAKVSIKKYIIVFQYWTTAAIIVELHLLSEIFDEYFSVFLKKLIIIKLLLKCTLFINVYWLFLLEKA